MTKGRVTYRVTEKSCKIIHKDCNQDFDPTLIGDEFHQQITAPWLPLKDGYYGIFPGVDQNYGQDAAAQRTWIQFFLPVKTVAVVIVDELT